MLVLALVALVIAALPAAIAAINLTILRSPKAAPGRTDSVSILIPARNEAAVIAATVEAALASRDVAIEVLVGDDHSTDATANLVTAIAARDPRVRLVSIPVLPEGWTGKNHACAVLAAEATGQRLLFVDADVTLAPDGAARLAAYAAERGAAMVSGVPRQVMPSMGERLTVPMINWLLVGYLPVWLMRRRPHDPSLGAACGQLVLVDRAAYGETGGHAAFRASLHDGLRLPRLLRRAGHRSDLVAAHTVASCRMYRDFPQAWAGFSKNAHEGLATPRALPVWTLLLAGGHVLPWLLLSIGAVTQVEAGPLAVAAATCAVSLGTRAAITLRTGEPLATIPLHPIAISVALAIQWNVLLRRQRAGAALWKGRRYPVA